MIKKQEETRQAELAVRAQEFKKMQAEAEAVSAYLHLTLGKLNLFVQLRWCCSPAVLNSCYKTCLANVMDQRRNPSNSLGLGWTN